MLLVPYAQITLTSVSTPRAAGCVLSVLSVRVCECIRELESKRERERAKGVPLLCIANDVVVANVASIQQAFEVDAADRYRACRVDGLVAIEECDVVRAACPRSAPALCLARPWPGWSPQL